MTVELDPEVEAFLKRLVPQRPIKVEQSRCKICNTCVDGLRDHLREAHQMSAASYRSLGEGYSLLPPSYAARKASYLKSLAIGG